MAGNSNSGSRKPVALKLYEGNRSKVAVARLQGEPKFALGVPACPAWMPELGKECWERVVRLLGQVPGLLQQTDFLVLERLALCYHHWRTWEAALEKQPIQETVYQSASGDEVRMLKPSPFVKMAKDSGAEIDRLMMRLGLSPADRSRLKDPAAVPATDDLLDADVR